MERKRKKYFITRKKLKLLSQYPRNICKPNSTSNASDSKSGIARETISQTNSS